MPALDALLVSLAAIAVLAWTALAAHLLAVERRRANARAIVGRIHDALGRDDARALPLADRVARLAGAVEGASRDLLMREAAAVETPAHVADALAAYIAERWGVGELERNAAIHRSARTKWRRTTALRILCRLKHPRCMELLALAAEQPDADVAATAFALLSTLDDKRAGDILVDALTRRQHPASRVAIHLDRSPVNVADRLMPLLAHRDATFRFWAAVLLGRYTGRANLDRALAPLTDDPDPRVRKAAVESLGRIGGALARDGAVRLLADPVPFVRANAARALGRLQLVDCAPKLTPLLGDPDWWVRFAARQALEMMGTDVWPVLVPCLTSPDRFVRNGAAEVFQNLGLLDSLIVMEAASDDPAPQKIDMLRRIAEAGGVRLTDSLVERAGSLVGARVRRLLTAIGFEDVGAA
jgi:HEAT repeat protein